MSTLEEKLEELARAPLLLVACDYDGTLAPIVEDPSRAAPNRETVVALRTLASLDNTQVAVISGRALRDLAALSGLPDEVHLVGSHGGEFDLDFSQAVPPDKAALRDQLAEELSAIAARDEGLLVEEKPASVAFHYRNTEEQTGQEALREVLEGPAAIEGVHVRHGKKVVELLVLPTNKGDALETLRSRLGASAVLFVGDDVTDEDGFATLAGPDLGVKVGPGDTRAAHRVEDVVEVARLLARLCQSREEWLSGGEAVRIPCHSLLSDHRTAALVTPGARITWLCLPRLDSPALFAEILGGPTAGYFSIRPAVGGAPLVQAYRPRSLAVETRWSELTVTDFLDTSLGRPLQRAGRSDLLRIVEGRGRVLVEFAPRLDFGRAPTRIVRHESGLRLEGSPDPVALRAPGVEWEIRSEGLHHTAVAELALDGGRVVFDLRYGTNSLLDTRLRATERRDLTDAHWGRWAASLVLPPLERELVLRSALTLKALCYAPTGAIAAAATTSLPEHIGGVRNWDYRYCWLRDGALTATALVKLGSFDEALAFLDWVLKISDACPTPGALRPLYALEGEQVSTEAEIGELSGYRGSRPVRVGNSATRQVQLDVFGPIVELIFELIRRDAPITPDHLHLVESMVQAVQERWREPDNGIWEVRLAPRHHVHSKTMCWVTVDRAIRIAHAFSESERPDWSALREEIAADILQHGWSEQARSFTTAYGLDDLDAAALLVGIAGLLPPDDPRFLSTVEATENHLRNGPTVYRYHFDDGLPGFEGGFHLCTSWLVDAYHLCGRADEARALFSELVALAGPTGLYSEEYGAVTKRALGNCPQAYTHVGLIENALRLSGGG